MFGLEMSFFKEIAGSLTKRGFRWNKQGVRLKDFGIRNPFSTAEKKGSDL